jgi:DNA polymerase-3 subunit delta
MEAKDVRELRTAISSGRFPPAYYFHGDDEYRKDELARELIEALVEPATRDFNLDIFRGSDADAERLESLLNTPPLMALRRAVVVRDTGGLRKDARAALERYLDHPSPDSVLVLVALAGTKEEKGLKSRATSVVVNPLEDRALVQWMIEHAQRLHGAKLLPAAATLLQRTVGTDTMQLAAELDKLASFCTGDAIDESSVEAVVGVPRGVTMDALLDAVAGRDLPAALAMVNDVLAQPRVSAVSVIMALTVQTLALMWGVLARRRGVSTQRLQGEYFALLRDTGAFPGRAWGDAARSWSRHVVCWDERSLSDALRALRFADQQAKDTRLSTDEQLLSTLVCAMCDPDSNRREEGAAA